MVNERLAGSRIAEETYATRENRDRGDGSPQVCKRRWAMVVARGKESERMRAREGERRERKEVDLQAEQGFERLLSVPPNICIHCRASAEVGRLQGRLDGVQETIMLQAVWWSRAGEGGWVRAAGNDRVVQPVTAKLSDSFSQFFRV